MGNPLLNTWHADQDEADVVAVEGVTQVLQGERVEAFRLIEDVLFQVFPRERAFPFSRAKGKLRGKRPKLSDRQQKNFSACTEL